MVRRVRRRAVALTKARERRRALYAAPDEHDRRIEQATAEALVTLEARQEAEQALQAATATLAETLHTLLAENVLAERAAAPLEPDTVAQGCSGATQSSSRSCASSQVATPSIRPATREATRMTGVLRCHQQRK